MDRTLRATLLTAFVGFAVVTGTALFLELPALGSVVAGVVAGVFGAWLIWAAARRAESVTDDEEPLPPIEPGFPGPPDHPDGTPHEDLDDHTDDDTP